MGRKTISVITLILFLTLMSCTGVNECQSFVEEWVPHVPGSAELKFWMSNGTSYMNVSMTFPDGGYKVSDWGTVVRDGGQIWVDSKVWDWTGYSVLWIITLSHTYDLGHLEGYYTFTFKAWGIDVESLSFKVTTAQLLLETDKDTYSLGENVTVTLTNIGAETVEIGGYPAWGIYSYPEETLVFPMYYQFLLWSLEPGENDTITWDQYNAFTQSPVDPGMYVVRDTKGWGLSAYLTITAYATATVDVDPNTLNLKSRGEWITCYIELPEGYDVGGIHVPSVKLNNTISVDLASTSIGDYDNDEVPDLTVKFSRTELTAYIYHVLGIKHGNVTLTISGRLFDGKQFEGRHIIRVIFGGDADLDGDIDASDFFDLSKAYGSDSSKPNWNPNCDFNGDGTVDTSDLSDLNKNYGATVP